MIKVAEQYPQPPEERAKGINPHQVVTKSSLRASRRALDESRSTEMEPSHSHTKPERGLSFRHQHRAERVPVQERQPHPVNGDSPITDVLWTHYYQPSKIRQDTIWHSAKYPSTLVLPVHE